MTRIREGEEEEEVQPFTHASAVQRSKCQYLQLLLTITSNVQCSAVQHVTCERTLMG